MNKVIIDKNYVIEDNIDFYAALEDSDNEDNENMCLISHSQLDNNSIVLNCGHKFNYIEIYNEVKQQKIGKHLSMDKNLQSLKRNEFLCPYCRSRQSALLPHIKQSSMNITYINGVNAPKHCCMDFNTCSYITKTGKNKGVQCSEHAFMIDGNRYCNKHVAYYKKKLQKQSTLSLEVPHEKCSAFLKTGKRKGEQCGAKIYDEVNQTCKRHTT